ncbi:uncharacterized protein LOC132904439 [Amyelois transitella]|uniref:uncharacterized protein LOC132904439 n=1 Tax=Amyelois transitella TaxID=680683 RepID=UPI00298F8802|nr:uncharacterized protein LOC132904439 [Amyelois transitella]
MDAEKSAANAAAAAASQSTQPDPAHVHNQPEIANISLALRIPPFWRDRPRLWFYSFEAATHEQRKGEQKMAQMVIARLEKQDIEQISDLLYNPPETNPYQAIKERLITAYEESDSRQFQKLLSEMELGDQKPTHLLRRMRDLARDRIPDATLRLMWTNHLPAHIRSVLAVSESFSSKTALEELALLADKMMEQHREISAVYTTTSSQSSSQTQSSSQPSDTQFLINELRKLSVEIAELKSRPPYNNNNYRRNRSQSRNRNYSRPNSRDNSPSPYCFYHRRFGAQARKCTSPCSYITKNEKPEN